MYDPARHVRDCRIRILAVMIAAVLFAFFGRPGAAAASETGALADRLIERAGMRRGILAVLGSDGNLAIDLARSSEMLIHVREANAATVGELRKEADEAGFGIGRLAVEQGPIDKLPYADNVIDVVIAAQVAADAPGCLSVDEILRVLRPEGTAIVGKAGEGEGAAEKLKEWAEAGGAQGVEAWSDALGVWVQLFKPPLEGADDWSHWEHSPDNNPVSSDTVIKAPYMTQFLQGPMYIGMPAITTAAGGRTFLASGHIAHHRREWDMLGKLIARNGYNGQVLWKRDLTDRYMVHRSAFIATDDTFYMIDGDRCLLLDPQTGREKGEIRIPGAEGEWKWMAMQDGILYVLAGEKGPGAITIKGDRTFGGWSWADLSVGYYRRPRVPWGFGKTLAAFNAAEKSLLWKHQEEEPIDSRAMAVSQKKVFLHGPEKHLRCLDADSGSVVWTNDDPEVLGMIEEPGRGLTSTPGFRSCCLAVATPEA
ncbi:MAG: PQQ-binding-like beta-propeller repeat protein, partial [Planctomycetes bacterium]|nr:PQQ-binding-like beta-propeller repeat protein [Planctomycetota bacterium]